MTIFFYTEDLYIDWYNDFLEEQWQIHLMTNYGHRLYNHTVVNPDTDETYYLVDQDHCPSEFLLNVKVPEQPEFEVLNSINPSSNCSSDGELTLKCISADLLPLSCEVGFFENADRNIIIKGLG